MERFKSFASSLYSVNETNFNDIALEVFHFQAQYNPVYNAYITALGRDHRKVNTIQDIPFLPISFFKTQSIKTGEWNPEVEFLSSGTTEIIASRHEVWNLDFYLSIAERIFEEQFGPLDQYHIFALLPSYLERKGSSLISMIEHFIKKSKSRISGFYLKNHDELISVLKDKNQDRKVILWGVSFALLDLAELGKLDLSQCMIFETGGMKGRRKEMVREEFHRYLKERFNANHIHSEYGMTELLSQAYSKGEGYFTAPAWMKIIIRDINDPFAIGLKGKTGGINVIDLANFHSCAFIETQDLGNLGQDGRFEVLGRFDNSDLRGCNLLV